jgi:acyl-CoA reductase-like NAD-dependent aldehyde dehydrogenase
LSISDVDVGYAAERCVAGGFSYSGQTCISVQRIYVQRTVYDNFLSTLVAGVKKLRIGNPADDSTDVGPLINEGAARRTEEWISEAAAGGAKIETGGTRGWLSQPS